MAGGLRIRSAKALESLGERAPGAPSVDSYLTKLVKMIPGEAQSLFAVGSSLIGGDADLRPYLYSWMGICGLIVVAVRWVGTADKVRKQPPDFVHILLSLLAYLVWIYATGSVLATWPNPRVHNFLPALLVLLFTFVAPYFYNGPEG